jgi:hypothetical protein
MKKMRRKKGEKKREPLLIAPLSRGIWSPLAAEKCLPLPGFAIMNRSDDCFTNEIHDIDVIDHFQTHEARGRLPALLQTQSANLVEWRRAYLPAAD